MAPEQFRGASPDARADQFSFAVALYEALYGDRPFAGLTLEDLLRELQGKPRPRPKSSPVPLRVHAAIQRALSALPEQRFASMEQLLAELRAGAREGRRITGRGVAGVAAAGIVLLAGLGAFALLRREPPARAQETPQPATTASTEVPTPLLDARTAVAPPVSASPPPARADARKPAPPKRSPASQAAPPVPPAAGGRPYDDDPLEPSFARRAR
jgi:hypothetical protein